MRVCDFCGSADDVVEVGLSIREILKKGGGQLVSLNVQPKSTEDRLSSELVGDICKACIKEANEGFPSLSAFVVWVRSRGT